MKPELAHPSPEWTDALLVDPHHQADKRSRVQKMFASIAPKYDLNNRLHSFWRDQAWRRKAVAVARLRVTDSVVDVACGTGDLTFAFARGLQRLHDASKTAPGRGGLSPTGLDKSNGSKARVTGIDFTFAMLPIANAKKKARRGLLPEFLQGDAQALALPDACCDVVSIAFGIRNVQDVPSALAEFYRVLRPGGRLIVLEFAKPQNRVIRWFNDLYTARIMPHTATWISGDKSGAYKYLPKSVETFIGREEMTRLIAAAGFNAVEQHPMTFGVCVCYRGKKSH